MTMTMGRESSPPPFCWFRLFFIGNIFLAVLICVRDVATLEMSAAEKKLLKEEAREMFYHAYHAYMNHAYPADELMPLSCKGRYRDSEPSRGDIDDALGNFSLTLVDAMDTLVILGDLEGFESAVRLVVNDVTFDHDIVVSVFETNIRMLGGLLSGHILAGYLRDKLGRMPWYKGELLDMAKDLGYRLLPAFNTSTGVPHPRINLQYGLKSPKMGSSRETCTACAGTMILEFAALSRLTGEPIFEEKTHRAMDYLWQLRHRASGLMGTVLNIHNGDWVRRDSGVGAGIDSYYEYLLKAYILLGDDTYLDRFNKHYSAIMKYISQGPLLVDVHMHRPHTNTKNFMDALLAFWPGLQVLKGDIKPAIETHEMLYQVMQRHNFLPEAFTTDFKVHWGQHPLRPEFLESTYFLYKATGDSYYLDVGKSVLNSLQKFARVPCGFAAVKDVRTGSHEDRMDSFVLAETFKYLFLLFAEDEDLVINIDDFLFTTEAHLFPLTLAKLSNTTSVVRPILLKMSDDDDQDEFEANYDHTCPNTEYLFPGKKDFAHSIRLPLKNLVDGVCPKQRQSNRQLRATEFQAGNEDHLRLLRKMGISIMALPDGRVQLQHTTAHAESSEDAEEGLLFMQEMIELSKSQEHQLSQQPRAVHFVARLPDGTSRVTVLEAGPAQFGPELNAASQVTALVALASPLRACKELKNAEALRNKVGVVERGDCMFVDKARQLQKAGAVAGIVIDNTSGTSSSKSPIFAMSGDGSNDVHIPMVFLFSQDAAILLDAMASDPHLSIKLTESAEGQSAESPMERVTTPETTNTDSGSLDVGYVRVDGDGRLHSEVSDSVTESDVVNEETDKRVEVSDDGRPKGPETVSKEREPSETMLSKSEKDDNDDVRREATVDPLVSLALLKNLKRFFDSGPISSVISVLNRETEHVKTLQSLIQTVLGDNKGMDTETKLLLDQVGEIIRLSGGVQSLSSTAEESGDDDVDGRIKTDVNNNDVADVSVEGESKPRTSSDVLQRNDNNDRDPEQSGAGPGAKRSMVNDEL